MNGNDTQLNVEHWILRAVNIKCQASNIQRISEVLERMGRAVEG